MYLQDCTISYILFKGDFVIANQEKKSTEKINTEHSENKKPSYVHASKKPEGQPKKKVAVRSAIKLENNKSYIQIVLRSYDKDALRCALRHLLTTLKSSGSDIKAIMPMPVRTKLMTVNRSPHIDKTSREQFFLKTHKCTVYVTPNAQTMDVLRVLVLPSAVSVTLK